MSNQRTHEHLTPDQLDEIRRTAIEETVNTAESDRGFLFDIVTQYIDSLSTQKQLDCISSDPECQTEMLGFDPTTGKTTTEAEASRRVEIDRLAAALDRYQIETLLGNASIQCYERETTEELRDALVENVLDGTIDIDDLRAAKG